MSLTINLAGDVVGTNNGNVIISINGPSPFSIAPSVLQWISSINSPTITQLSTSIANGVGQNLTIQAQSATGSGSTAGNLNLAAGTALTAATTGDVNIQGGTPTSLVNIVTFNATDFDSDGLVETIGIGSSLVSPRIYQITGSASGTNLTIQAQNAAGTNKNGGSLLLKGGAATGTGQSGGIVPSVQVRTNTSNSIYTIDSTGGGIDYHILHNNITNTFVSYVMPTPTAGRELFLRDITGTINNITISDIPTVFLIPHASERFNASPGYVMSGTFSIINGSTTVTASTTQSGILVAGMSIVFGTDTKSYIVSAFNGTTGITLTSSYTGNTNSTSTGTINSLTFAANYGVLRLVSDGTNWYAKGDGTLTSFYYLANGTFIAPQGVTAVTLIGYGGGGGGGSGGVGATTNTGGGGGGGGALQSTVIASVTPSTANSIVIGSGGTGGTGVTSASSVGNNGNNGTDTIFTSSVNTYAFLGASGGGGGVITASNVAGGGLCSRGGSNTNYYGAVTLTTQIGQSSIGAFTAIASGGFAAAGAAGQSGTPNTTMQFSSTGGVASTAGGGGGGGSGPGGSGTNGTAGVASGTSSAPNTIAANTGAGGGGGGGNGTASTTSGAGGNGSSGYLTVIYSL